MFTSSEETDTEQRRPARTALFSFRVTPTWLAQWKREKTRIQRDTGISDRVFTSLLIDVLQDALPEVRERAVQQARQQLRNVA